MKISDSFYSNYPVNYSASSQSDPSRTSTAENKEQKLLENKGMETNNPSKEKKEISEESVIKAIEKANKQLEMTMTSLKFSIHKETKQIMVKVIDSKTKEVIREIPPEKVLDMVAKMWERAGLFVDKKS